MFLKYYLAFCVVAYVLMIFSAYTITLNMSLKCKEFANSIDFFNWLDLKLIVVSFIPVVNVITLFILLFFGNEIEHKLLEIYQDPDR